MGTRRFRGVLRNFGLVFLSLWSQLEAESWAGIPWGRHHPVPYLAPAVLAFAGGPCPRAASESQGPLVWPSSYVPWRQWRSDSNIQLGLYSALLPWNWALVIDLSVGQEFTHTVHVPVFPFVCALVFYFQCSFEGSACWVLRLRCLKCRERFSQKLMLAIGSWFLNKFSCSDSSPERAHHSPDMWEPFCGRKVTLWMSTFRQ